MRILEAVQPSDRTWISVEFSISNCHICFNQQHEFFSLSEFRIAVRKLVHRIVVLSSGDVPVKRIIETKLGFDYPVDNIVGYLAVVWRFPIDNRTVRPRALSSTPSFCFYEFYFHDFSLG